VVGELIRTDEEQAALKGNDRAAILAMDERGDHCACGVEPDQICLAHWAIHGHRRHVRPGRQTNDKRAHRQVGRPRYTPDPYDDEAA
jgi:hypothetical protein